MKTLWMKRNVELWSSLSSEARKDLRWVTAELWRLWVFLAGSGSTSGLDAIFFLDLWLLTEVWSVYVVPFNCRGLMFVLGDFLYR